MRTKKRFLSLLLCSVMLLVCYSPAASVKAGPQGSEQHAEHIEDSNTQVIKCVHEHTKECYPSADEGTAAGDSANENAPEGADAQEPSVCTHECSEETGCIVPAPDGQQKTKDSPAASLEEQPSQVNGLPDAEGENVLSPLEAQVQLSTRLRSAGGVIGTANRPFSISSEEALLDLQKKVESSKTYEVGGQSYDYAAAAYQLDNSFALSGRTRTAITGIADGFVLDGKGYAITGLSGSEGLFNEIPQGAAVRNLTLHGELNEADHTGMLCEENAGTIEKCTVQGLVTGERVGGITWKNDGKISVCVSEVSVEGIGGLGGIAAFHSVNGEISGCENRGAIHELSQEANTYRDSAGGIAGEAAGSVKDCSNTGAVTNEDGDYGHAGGIVGYCDRNPVEGCRNWGTVKASAGDTGGIAGYGAYAAITTSENLGEVIGTGFRQSAGGILGVGYEGEIRGCHNAGNVTQSGDGGIAGGILGWHYAVQPEINGQNVYECWNSGSVFGVYVGGISGQIGYLSVRGTIKDCYNVGVVRLKGNGYAGGIAGCANNGTGEIINCYNTGKISTDGTETNGYIGGIMGNGTKMPISGCYALNETVHNLTGTRGRRIREWNGDDLSDNHAWDQMLVNGKLAADGTATNRDGADVTSAQLKDPSNSAGLWAAFSDNAWTEAGGALPILKNAVGEQDAALPAHIENGTAVPVEPMTLKGSGTTADPYQITSVEEWNYVGIVMGTNFNITLRNTYRLAAFSLEVDLDLPASAIMTLSSSSCIFSGHFNGNGHKLTGVIWTGKGGIFSEIGPNGVVENLIVECNIQNNRDIGAIAGENSGTIRNCQAKGSVTLAGNGTAGNAGGIVGYNKTGTVENCTADVNVSAMKEGSADCVGGIAGYQAVKTVTIKNCRSTGKISAAGNNANTGGIVGSQGSTAVTENCYSTAIVSGGNAGGIVGGGSNKKAGTVQNCVSLAESIEGADTGTEGRIFGDSTAAVTLSGNYGWEQMTGSGGSLLTDTLSGAVGNRNGLDATKDMLQDGGLWTGLGWDFDNIWKVEQGKLPAFSFEPEPLTLSSHLTGQAPDQPRDIIGDGTKEAPYEIHSTADLLYLAQQMSTNDAYLSACYRLHADIDLSTASWTAIGTEDKPFAGTFDGGGHRISNLKIQKAAEYQGFFSVTDGAVIKNLIVQGSVEGSGYAGGIVGYAKGQTVIEACQSKVDVHDTSGTSGGVVGINEGMIRHLIQTGDVSGQNGAGGIAGENRGMIEHAFTIGALTADQAGSGAGGIAVINDGTIRSCAALTEHINVPAGGAAVIGRIAVSGTGTQEGNYVWSDIEITGTLDMTADGDLKESAITLISKNKDLFPESLWELKDGFYPILRGQTDINYILPHQINDGRQLIGQVRLTLPEPKAGEEPVAVLSGDGWKAAVTWTPDPEGSFGYETAYTASIVISPEEGYQLSEQIQAFLNEEEIASEANQNGTITLTKPFAQTEVKPVDPGEEEKPPVGPGEAGKPPIGSGEEEEEKPSVDPGEGGKPISDNGGKIDDASDEVAESNGGTAVNTGDNNRLVPIVSALLLSVFTLVLARRKRKQIFIKTKTAKRQ